MKKVKYLLALPRLRKGNLTEGIKFRVDTLRNKSPTLAMYHTNWRTKTYVLLWFEKENYEKHSFYYEKYRLKYEKFRDKLLGRLRRITRLRQFRPRRLAKMKREKRNKIWKPQLEKNLEAIKKEAEVG